MNPISTASGNSLPVRGVEKGFVVLVLILSMGAFQNLSIAGPIETQNMGMVGMQILWSILYLITLIFYFRNCDRPLQTIFIVSPIIVVVLVAAASTFWSQDQALTLRRSVALILTLVFGVYFASRFSRKDQLRLLAWALSVCIVFSFLFELFELNPSQGFPGWYGVFDIKNELGQTMVLSTLVFLFLKKIEPKYKVRANIGFVASVILLILSRAMTATVIFFSLLVLIPYLEWTFRKGKQRVFGGIAFLLVGGMSAGFYILTHLDEVTRLLGKDPALTGRLPLWIVSAIMALQRPWLGYGFNAFWLPNQTYMPRMWQLLSWMPPQAHNGILELWLEVGLIGTGVFLFAFAHYAVKALKLLRHDADPTAAWPASFLILFFLGNLTTAFFLVTNNVYFILYVALAASMCMKDDTASVFSRTFVPKPSHV